MFKGHGILGLYTANVQSSKDQSVTIACSQLIETEQSSALKWSPSFPQYSSEAIGDGETICCVAEHFRLSLWIGGCFPHPSLCCWPGGEVWWARWVSSPPDDCPLFQDDDLEEGEVKDPSDRKVRPRPTCRFFMKGNCSPPASAAIYVASAFLGPWW